MFEKKLRSNDLCWCKSGKCYKDCHEEFERKLAVYRAKGYKVPDRSLIKTNEQIEKIIQSAKINIAVLDYVSDNIKVGMTTQEIDDLVSQKTHELGGICAPYQYNGFPKSVCTSINNQVCHGIPDNTVLQEGDIINVDVSTILDGYYSDSSRMFCIGKVSDARKRLVEVTKECIQVGLDAIVPYTPIGNVGYAIHQHALKNGYSVVKEVGGHGVGIEFHEEPFVSFVAKKGTGMLMVPGMMFTIEPMVNMGKPQVFLDSENEWTIYTMDDSDSAQWEVQVLITEEGYKLISW